MNDDLFIDAKYNCNNYSFILFSNTADNVRNPVLLFICKLLQHYSKLLAN